MFNLPQVKKYFSPFSDLTDNLYYPFSSEFSKMFGDSFPMPLRMWETDTTWTIEADLPGVEKDNLDVAINGRVAHITATRHEANDQGKNCRNEVYYGKLDRTITIPNTVNVDTCSADLKNGVLTLSFKKAKDNQVHKIEVK